MDLNKIRSINGYPSYIVVAHTGFKVPANSLEEAQAIKDRLDARYPNETSKIKVN